MDIEDAANKFYKKIWDSPNREEIKTVVGKLNSSSRGYGNKIIPTPMLGLLLYNQEQLKKAVGRSAIEELEAWSERELKILFGVHNQVRRLNQQCLAPLKGELTAAINAVNPYKEYPQTVSTEGFEELLFKQEDAEELIQIFQAHPAFNIALSNLELARKRPLDHDQTIGRFISEITEAGPGGEPQWVTNYEHAKREEHPEVGLFHHIASLICLYDSLANLDQLIYQGLFQDELIELNRGRTIDFLMTTRGAGPSMWLIHVPFGYMYLLAPSDLIIVKIDKPGITGGLGDVLCRIHTQIIPGDNASPGKLKVRMIDKNLNAYSYLIR